MASTMVGVMDIHLDVGQDLREGLESHKTELLDFLKDSLAHELQFQSDIDKCPVKYSPRRRRAGSTEVTLKQDREERRSQSSASVLSFKSDTTFNSDSDDQKFQSPPHSLLSPPGTFRTPTPVTPVKEEPHESSGWIIPTHHFHPGMFCF